MRLSPCHSLKPKVDRVLKIIAALIYNTIDLNRNNNEEKPAG